jgi:biopolymer transport protein ExbD
MAAQVRQFDEINITPLTDIFLVLLIIMMVVAPMMQQQRQDIKLPGLQKGVQLEPTRYQVEVDAKGATFLNGKPVLMDQLASALKAEVQATGTEVDATGTPKPKVLVVRGDKTARAQLVLQAFDAARDAGIPKVVLAGEPVSSSPTDKPSLSESRNP